MAVYLKPCTGCPLRNGCEQRSVFRKRVAGLGLRSATFNCDLLTDAIRPGSRIVVSHPFRSEQDNYNECSVRHEHMPATIISSRGDEFCCVIDRDAMVAKLEELEGEEKDPDKVRFRRTMKARRIIRFLDEPRRTRCADGGRLQLPSGGCDKRQDEECVCKVFAYHIQNGAGTLDEIQTAE